MKVLVYTPVGEFEIDTEREYTSEDAETMGTTLVAINEMKSRNAPAAPPRINSFLLAVLNLFGIADGNALLAKYPLFTAALNAQNWMVTQQTLQYAQKNGDITMEQYRQIVTVLAPEYAIPLTSN